MHIMQKMYNVHSVQIMVYVWYLFCCCKLHTFGPICTMCTNCQICLCYCIIWYLFCCCKLHTFGPKCTMCTNCQICLCYCIIWYLFCCCKLHIWPNMYNVHKLPNMLMLLHYLVLVLLL